MSKYDHESLLKDVKAIMKASLNDKLDSIEAEKVASGFVATGLPHVDVTDGYFEQTWSEKILNITPAIFFGIEDVKAQGIGPSTIETIQLFVEVVLVDSGNDTLAKNKIHRYSRALREVFEENYDRIPSGSQIKIETVRPVSFKLDLNTSDEIKVGGISITTALA